MTKIAVFLAASLFMVSATSYAASEPDEINELDGNYVGLSYSDPDEIEFLKRVLESIGHPYKAVSSSEGVTVYYQPVSPAQEQEVSNRVSQYTFVRDVCKQLPLPKPSDPAQEELSC